MIVEFFYAGLSVSELGREYGVSDVYIYKWIIKYKAINPADSESPTIKKFRSF